MAAKKERGRFSLRFNISDPIHLATVELLEKHRLRGTFLLQYDALLKGASWHRPDHHFLLLDFAAYQAARLRAYMEYKDEPRAFARKCLLNIAGAGPFSADRAVRQYAENIWRV